MYIQSKLVWMDNLKPNNLLLLLNYLKWILSLCKKYQLNIIIIIVQFRIVSGIYFVCFLFNSMSLWCCPITRNIFYSLVGTEPSAIPVVPWSGVFYRQLCRMLKYYNYRQVNIYNPTVSNVDSGIDRPFISLWLYHLF